MAGFTKKLCFAIRHMLVSHDSIHMYKDVCRLSTIKVRTILKNKQLTVHQ